MIMKQLSFDFQEKVALSVSQDKKKTKKKKSSYTPE